MACLDEMDKAPESFEALFLDWLQTGRVPGKPGEHLYTNLDRFGVVLFHRPQTQRVVIAHLALIYKAQAMRVTRCLVNRIQQAASGFGLVDHGISPVRFHYPDVLLERICAAEYTKS